MSREAYARIDELPRRWSRESPEAVALREGERNVDWRTLQRAIDRGAQWLAGEGAGRGDRVMIVAENSIAMIALLFAASASGATAVIVNPRLSERELDGIRDHASPRVTVLVGDSAAEIDAHAERCGATPVAFTDVGPLRVSCREDSTPDHDLDDVAAIVYTSGTSGRPKGVMLTHANLLFVATASAQLRRLGPTDRVFGALPIYHVYGLASVLLGTFCAGACLVLFARFDARRAIAALARGELTVFQGVPAMYARMLERLGTDGRAATPGLRYLYAGGSPLDRTLKADVERRFGLPLHNGYGLTECSPTVSQTRLDAPRADTSVGPPIPGIRISIVGEGDRDVGNGGVGELCVSGPNVMKGYYRDADATAEAITRDGWLRTGDLARQDDDGALHIVGRSKELIIRSGLNVYPIEIETVLNAHPAVSQSVVVGRALADANEEVVAFVELAPGANVTSAELLAYAGAQLAPYKRPTELKILDALPSSGTGKVLRGQLKSLADRSSR
ncbi:MAG TPA: AMP-binding protein [Casimicrobiaceae bacterium]|nr:AMP-binding protein [Casimicrobiaceae bacterium]